MNLTIRTSLFRNGDLLTLQGTILMTKLKPWVENKVEELLGSLEEVCRRGAQSVCPEKNITICGVKLCRTGVKDFFFFFFFF